MHSVSTLWQEMIDNPLVCKNEKIIIAGTEYGVSQLVGGTVSEECMSSTFEIGNAIARELQIKLFPTAPIPRTAKIERYVQLVIKDASGAVTTESEWIPKGVFYVDTRPKSPNGMYTLTAYDSMLKTDSKWWDSSRGTGTWPMSMNDAVLDIASTIGVEVDSRTVINATYTVDYPNDRTMREILCDIASAHGGIWVITDENKLRLLTFKTIDTSITSGFINVGSKLGHFESSDAFEPITRATLYWDDENAFTSPKDATDTGREIVADCLSATQVMTDNLLAQLNGFRYQPFTSNKAWLNPAYELGDIIYINGIWSYILNVSSSISNSVICSVTAPYEQEVDHEFPYVGTVSRNLKRKVALGQSYYGVSISRDKGIYIQKTDGENVQGEAMFNSDTLAMRAVIDGIMKDCIYFDTVAKKYRLSGDVLIDGSVQSDAVVTDALYAEQGDVSQLTVDWLDTSKRVKRYLLNDTSDDNHIEIHDSVLNFISSSVVFDTNGTPLTEQLTNRYGSYLYWKKDISDAEIVDGYPYVDDVRVYATEEDTGYPIIVYQYKDLVKRSINFLQDNDSGVYLPTDIFGAGISEANPYNGVGKILKTPGSFELSYTTSTGVVTGVYMRDDGFVDAIHRRANITVDTVNKQFVISPEGALADAFTIDYTENGNTLSLTWPDGKTFKVVKN